MSSGRRFTLKDKRTIKELVKEGCEISIIAEAIKVSTHDMYAIFSNLGYKRKSKGIWIKC
jgi:hypothetical protein